MTPAAPGPARVPVPRLRPILLGAALGFAGALACNPPEPAAGLCCETHEQCGGTLRCEGGYCGGRPAGIPAGEGRCDFSGTGTGGSDTGATASSGTGTSSGSAGTSGSGSSGATSGTSGSSA